MRLMVDPRSTCRSGEPWIRTCGTGRKSYKVLFFNAKGFSSSFFFKFFFSIKHDLARSCFKFWLKIGDEGGKISRKNWRGASRDSFFLEILSPSEPILRAIIENMISPDYVLCYIPRALETLDKK